MAKYELENGEEAIRRTVTSDGRITLPKRYADIDVVIIIPRRQAIKEESVAL